MAGNFNENNHEMEDLSDVDKAEGVTDKVSCSKSQNLVDIANKTFKELCRTLENEQIKLNELEERRKKLQDEMQRLKMEIEEEKQSYRLNLVDSVTENLVALSVSDNNVKGVEQESVPDFLKRQQAELQKLTQESAQFPLLNVGVELSESTSEGNNTDNSNEILTASGSQVINEFNKSAQC